RFCTGSRRARGIAGEVVRGVDVEIGPDASIWPFVTLGDRVRLGARVTLYPGVFVGDDAVVGDDSILHPNVTVREGCVIGRRVLIHSGAVLGSDGFGYVQHEGRHHKIPQLGGVAPGRAEAGTCRSVSSSPPRPPFPTTSRFAPRRCSCDYPSYASSSASWPSGSACSNPVRRPRASRAGASR